MDDDRLEGRLNAAQSATERRTEGFLDGASQSPPVGKRDFILEDWDSVRNGGTKPLNVTDYNASPELRQEFLRGAEAMGLGTWRMPELFPQQLMVADVLNNGKKFNSILMPRRSTKTTSIVMWMIGRCLSRPGYKTVYTMLTTGKKTTDRFTEDIVPALLAQFPDKDTAPFKIYKGVGHEKITFHNGSTFKVVAPNGNEFRSDAFDVVCFDEAGEPEPGLVKDILGAALPTMDTRPGSMLIVAGTAGKYRSGNLLWDELSKAREGRARSAVLDFSVDDATDGTEWETWEGTVPLLELSHPGLHRAVQLEDLADTYERVGPVQFSREYLGIFGALGGTRFIPPAAWEKCALDPVKFGARPEHFAVAIAVHFNQTSAAIVAAWRDSDGHAYLEVLEHDAGVTWLVDKGLLIARKYRIPISYDDRDSGSLVEVERLQRSTPRPQLNPMNWAKVSTAAATLVKEIQTGNLRHMHQEPLDAAVEVVTKRGTPNSTKWTLGRGTDAESDITPLEAGMLALSAYDALPKRRVMPQLIA